MNNTALGAKKDNIIFISDTHEKFYYEKLKEVWKERKNNMESMRTVDRVMERKIKRKYTNKVWTVGIWRLQL